MSISKIDLVLYSNIGKFVTAPKASIGKIGGQDVPVISTRGIYAGGANSGPNVIQYVTIETTGNAIDFGDLMGDSWDFGALASSTRGIFICGNQSGVRNIISYITISTLGNASDFGDALIPARSFATCSSSTRGLKSGGYFLPADTPILNVIDYITIATLGNTTDFGDLSIAVAINSGSASPTRGVFYGGMTTIAQDSISYVTINTTGNTTNFGNLSVAAYDSGACSSNIRGLVALGYTSVSVNTIEYITIDSIGNTIDFGDLTVVRSYLTGCSSPTRGVFFGGFSAGVKNTIDYVTIASTGNATDFGYLIAKEYSGESMSNGHGGLQ